MNYINSALQILTLFFISHYLKNVTINLRAKLLSICAQKFLILCAKQHHRPHAGGFLLKKRNTKINSKLAGTGQRNRSRAIRIKALAAGES